VNTIFESIDRIRKMEAIFDKLTVDIREDPPKINKKMLQILIDYYDNGEWMHDYELDEAGLLPSDLKRGVLSEDGVYNLLSSISEVLKLK